MQQSNNNDHDIYDYDDYVHRKGKVCLKQKSKLR